MNRAKVRSRMASHQDAVPCAARQSRPVRDDLRVMSQRCGNERAEGRKVTVTDPVWRIAGAASIDVAQSLAGSMWPTVVARKSDHFRRRTDDEHSDCVLSQSSVRPRFCCCGHYELCGYTDESSATRTISRQISRGMQSLFRGICASRRKGRHSVSQQAKDSQPVSWDCPQQSHTLDLYWASIVRGMEAGPVPKLFTCVIRGSVLW